VDIQFLIRTIFYNLASNSHLLVLGLAAILTLGFGPLGRALAQRLRSGGAAAGSSDHAFLLKELREQLGDVQERLDFNERILSDIRQSLLGTGRHGAEPRIDPAATPV
jgi:hypothetical protein